MVEHFLELILYASLDTKSLVFSLFHAVCDEPHEGGIIHEGRGGEAGLLLIR